MSYEGKRVEFLLSNGERRSGIVVKVRTRFVDTNQRWYELDSGWTVNEDHVVAARWIDPEKSL